MNRPHLPAVFKSRWLIALAVVAVLVGAYAWAGYQFAPRWVRATAIEQVQQRYGRKLAIGEVKVDPFRLTLSIRDLALPDVDGTTMLGFGRLAVDFEASSIWNRAWVFDSVALETPVISAVLRSDGRINLADLAPPDEGVADASEADDEAAALPRIWLRTFDVTGGDATYREYLRRQKPFERRFAPFAFSLKDFRTTEEGGDFRFAARGDAGEQFDWKGKFQLAPLIASQGDFSIEGVEASGIGEFLGEAVPFDISKGVVGLGGSYTFTLAREIALQVRLPELVVTDLALRTRGGDTDWVTVPGITAEQIDLQLEPQSVTVGSLKVAGPQVTAFVDAQGGLNLLQLMDPEAGGAHVDGAGAATASQEPPAAAITTSAPDTSSGGWTVALGDFELTEGGIDFEDRMAQPFKQFAARAVRATAKDLSLDLSQAIPVTFATTVNDVAVLEVAGSVTPAPLAAELDVSLQGARLAILQPYILPIADLTLRSGTVATRGKLRIAPEGSGKPSLAFDGDVTFDRLRSVDNALKEDLFNFRQLQLRQVHFTQQPDLLRIGQIRVREPYARVSVGQDQILNINAVLDPEAAAQQRAAFKAQQEALAKETPAERRRRENAEEKEQERRDKEARNAPAAAPTAAPEAPETFPIRIAEVRIENGRMNFSDYNIRPNFSAEIQALTGTLTSLSTAFDSRATVDLAGNLGEFSPVTISGTVQPFAFDRFTDIGLLFENISLPVLNPYSGQFAGFNISKGKLKTDLHYLITDRKLDAKHKITIDQLEWGEASEFKGEATLPVKFATALLRDRHGVINLDIPVKGTLDDPTLRIGPIVWQIIRNLIVKAVTAPFALLGALFAGAEEAQFVDFAPGDAALDAMASERLAQLAKGLAEKNGISLDVPIGTVAEIDLPALRERHLQQLLNIQIDDTLRRREDDETPLPAFASLTPKQQIDVLTAVLKSQGGEVPKAPEPAEPPEGTSRAEARVLRDQATVTFLEAQARERASAVPDDAMTRLGEARADAVQKALLAAGELPPERVFTIREGKVAASEGKVRLQLDLK